MSINDVLKSVWTEDCQVFWWVAKCRSTTICIGLDSSWILQNISFYKKRWH